MLRFPNPSSSIGNFVAVYRAALNEFRGYSVTLDNIVASTVKANLATSSGHMGSQAVTRSTRGDRSRDPLYNQLKMYAELFRFMGWLHRTESSALQFTFTLLGEQLVKADRNYLPFIGEVAIGIEFPSRLIQIRGSHELRPFAFLLKTMLACDGGSLAGRDDRRPIKCSHRS